MTTLISLLDFLYLIEADMHFCYCNRRLKYAKETRKTGNIRQTWHKLDKKLIRKRIITTAIIYLGKEVP